MQPALSTPFAQPPIPAWGKLSEKPRLGFTSKNPALHLRQSVCNSTTALGFEAALHLNRVRSRCSGEQYDSDLGLYYLRARYYNPATGRFLSRDPDDHSILSPNHLHKYLYANGDPVNSFDSTGRGDDEVDYALTQAMVVKKVFATARAIGTCGALAIGADLLAAQIASGKPASNLQEAALLAGIVSCIGNVGGLLF